MTQPKILLDSPCKTAGPRFEEREDGRFCHHCQEMQYDLRDATRAEVVALIVSKRGRICGRLRTGPGGEPKFKPEPPPRGQQMLRGAAVALALAACDSPSETSVTAEPTVAAPPPSVAAPPTSVAEAPPPPTTTVGIDPPPVSVATADDTIDHSTDDSPRLEDHRQHRHTHPVATPDDAIGELQALEPGGYAGGLAIQQPGPIGTGSGGR